MTDRDYENAIREAVSEHAAATSAVAQAEGKRDYAIRAAHMHAGLSVRAISALAGISPSRVQQVLARDSVDNARNRRTSDS